jgi:6,7-dimethyl-8-ribityllumazine synthase
MTTQLKIAFIKARWHAEIVDKAHEGFVAELKSVGRDAQVLAYDVPGAFEMPLLAKKLAATGKFDAIVAAALVVDGGIYRHDFVASAVVNGLMEAQMATGVPVFSVSLTPHHFQPTPEHIGFYTQHFVKKGAEAAHAVLGVVDLDLAVV